MKKYKIIPSSSKIFPVAAIVSCMFYSGLAYSVSIRDSNITESTWLSPSDEISISFDISKQRHDTSFKFVLAKQDISVLFIQIKPGVYVYKPSVMPLPIGLSKLKVYIVENSGQWKEVAVLPINVKTSFGFKESNINATVDVNIKSEIDSGYNGDAVAPPVEQQGQTTMTTNIAVSSSASNDDFSLQSNLNLIGVSKYEEALRFGEKGFDADKLDLSDYLLQVNSGKHRFSLGHVSFGQNRFLISGFGSRGLTYNGKFGANDAFDFSMAKMNGNSIVGYSNITGLTGNKNNRVLSTMVGYDFIPSRPGGLRAELTYLDASLLPLSNFDQGQITDAEKSSGYGLKLFGASESDSLRGELTYATSKYTNPADPFLFQDDAVVEVQEQTDNALYAEMTYALYQGQPDEKGDVYSVTATVSHEKVDPLYKSLAAYVNPDTQTNSLAVSMQLGAISLQINSVKNEDNIDDLDTILKTKTNSDGISMLVPFKQIFSVDGKNNNWIPNVDIQLNRVHQFGANQPVSFDPDTHIPDQMNETQSYRLSWDTDKLGFSFLHSLAEQDNRQIGRATADFETVNNSVDVSYQFTNNFDANIGLGKVEVFDRENNLTTFDDTYSFGFNWGISDKIRLTTTYSGAATVDSLQNATRDSYAGNMQLSWQFEMPTGAGRKMPGQFFISYSMQNNRTRDNVFITESNAQDWIINAGLNISLF